MSKATKRISYVIDKIIAGGGRLTKAQQDIADFACSWCHQPLGRLAPIERGVIEAATKSDPTRYTGYTTRVGRSSRGSGSSG